MRIFIRALLSFSSSTGIEAVIHGKCLIKRKPSRSSAFRQSFEFRREAIFFLGAGCGKFTSKLLADPDNQCISNILPPDNAQNHEEK